MSINRLEHTVIKNDHLFQAWKREESLAELESFLQFNWEQRSIFYEDRNPNTKQQFIKFLSHGDIKTHNYVGTITFNGEKLNIFPKVFRPLSVQCSDENLSLKHLMDNIVQWLEYCNRISYPFINIFGELSDSKDFLDLFITLYINMVLDAIDRGIYYQYEEETEDCKCIKGKFDVKDYFISKIPGGEYDRFSCTYSNFQADNMVNRIIKYTCMLLLNAASDKNSLKIRKIINKLDEVTFVRCVPQDCDNIRLSKMHRKYYSILNLSKMFLSNKTSTFDMDINDTYCFLFPMEQLFEGFVGGYLSEVLSDHDAKVELQKSDLNLIDDVIYKGQNLGPSNNMKQDIVVTTKNKMFVLDTKYKEITRFEDHDVKSIIRNEISQSDLYQMCEYARKRGVNDVYLLYPMNRYEDPENDFPCGISKSPTGNIFIHFIRIPCIFEENDFEELKKKLKRTILKIFDVN